MRLPLQLQQAEGEGEKRHKSLIESIDCQISSEARRSSRLFGPRLGEDEEEEGEGEERKKKTKQTSAATFLSFFQKK